MSRNTRERKDNGLGVVALVVLILVSAVITLLVKGNDLMDNATAKINRMEEKITDLKRQLKKEKEAPINYRPPVSSAVFSDKKLMKHYINLKNDKMFNELADIIIVSTFKYAKKYNLPPSVLMFLMDVESDYDPWANSGQAIGLMQVNPAVWINDKNNKADLVNNGVVSSKKELWEPGNNIRAGAYILRHYLNQGLKYEREGRLRDLGYFTPMEYAVRKYFGGTAKTYYKKIKNSVGDYWFYTFSKSKTMKTEKVNKQVKVSKGDDI